jgi:hypothetical protein
LADGRHIDYIVDPQGRRIGKKIDGQLQWGLLYQDQLNPVARLKPDGTIDSMFLYAESGHVPSVMLKDGKRYRNITDQYTRV